MRILNVVFKDGHEDRFGVPDDYALPDRLVGSWLHLPRTSSLGIAINLLDVRWLSVADE